MAAASGDVRIHPRSADVFAEFVEDEEERKRWLSDLDELERIADSAILLVREESGRASPEILRLDTLVSVIAGELKDQNLDVTVAGAEPDAESPWWRMRELLSLVERDFAGLVPRVRAAFDELEARFAREAAAGEAEADQLRRAGNDAGAADVFTGIMARATSAWLARASELVREIREGS